jgi:hypothetical protein
MSIEDLIEDLKAIYDKYSKVAGLLLPVFILMPKIPKASAEPAPTQPPSEPLQIPPEHQALADKIKAYYPWKELTKKCVFVGTEQGEYSETCWLWLFIDQYSSDVALVMTMIRWSNYFSIEFARMDGLDGEKVTVEVEGYGKYESIFTRTEAQKGYWGLSVNA